MVEPNRYKIYKGIQKEIRFLFMERTIAMEFLLTTAITGFLMLILLGPNTITMLICGVLTIIYFSFYKRKDVKNQKMNLKKKSINKRKPSVIKTREMIILKKNGSFFN